MRKFRISVLMMTLLLLAGCGEREARLERGFSEFRDAMTATEDLAAEAELTVTAGETVSEYRLSMTYDGRETAVTVLEPEIIGGVTAVSERGQTEIVYGSVRLGAGPLDASGLTPVSVLPAFIDAVQSGYLELLWWEEPYICARLHVSDTSVLTLWLEEETLVPAVAELASEGRTVARFEFTEWALD